MQSHIREEPPSFYTIYLDNTPWKVVSKSLFKKALKTFSFDTSLEEIEKRFEELEKKIAKNYAIWLLSKRSFFTQELYKKLEKKGFGKKAQEEAVAYLQKIGALKEESLAKAFVVKRMKKGYSRSFAQRELSIKNQGLIPQQILSELPDETHLIQELFKKKFSTGNLKDVKFKQKVYHFFLRRGFSSEQILEVLSEIHRCN